MITSPGKAIQRDVRARIVDYVMITSLSTIFIVRCLLLVGAKLSNAFVAISAVFR